MIKAVKLKFSCPREAWKCKFNGWFQIVDACKACEDVHYIAKCPTCDFMFYVNERDIILKDENPVFKN